MFMQSRYQQGVTITEVVVTVAIIGIIAAIAIPSYQDYIARERLSGAVEAIYGQTQLAKRQAISNNDSRYLITTTGSNWCAGVSASSTASCLSLDVYANSTDYPGTEITLTASPVEFEMPELLATPTVITITIDGADSRTVTISSNQLVQVN